MYELLLQYDSFQSCNRVESRYGKSIHSQRMGHAAASRATVPGKRGLGALVELQKETSQGRRRRAAPALLDFRPTLVRTREVSSQACRQYVSYKAHRASRTASAPSSCSPYCTYLFRPSPLKQAPTSVVGRTFEIHYARLKLWLTHLTKK